MHQIHPLDIFPFYLALKKKNYILNRQEVTQDKKVKLHFIKCHAPWEVLLFYAEELNFRAPLEVGVLYLSLKDYCKRS